MASVRYGLQKPALRKAAVIGAGSMGSGIAAQFANAGIPVVLLDLAAKDGAADAVARGGVERQLKAGGFMHPDAAKLVETGTIEHDLGKLADADWIVEAIVELIDVKRSLYEGLAKVKKPGAIVSSNTSTLRLARLVEGLPPQMRKDFLITHFFNPPRHMRLVELVGGPDTESKTLTSASVAAEMVLGKTPVVARDTPGFIANRIGCAWMAVAAIEAIRHGVTVEEADAILGAPFGVPRTGVFGLFDLVGIDLVPPIWGSLRDALPAGDLIQRYDLMAEPAFKTLVERKHFGRKSGAGFYRLNKDRTRDVLDFGSLDYRREQKVELPALAAAGRSLRKLCESDDKAGSLAWRVLSELVVYAAELAEEIAPGIGDIDTAMQLGYSWAAGPFALADQVGADYIVGRLEKEGRAVPAFLAKAAASGGFYLKGDRMLRSDGGRYLTVRPGGQLRLVDVKADKAPVLENAGAALLDIGEGVACLEFRNKMNVFDDAVFELIEQTVLRLPKDFQALVVGNDDPRAFSAGANLKAMLALGETGDRPTLEAFLQRGQAAFQSLKYAPFPVVGAGHGLALGGGCEVLLHCDEIVAHAELNAGLPEVKVGLVPGWGGCTQMLLRFAAKADARHGPQAVAAQAFETIFSGRNSSSALDASDMGILRRQDHIVMNRDFLLAEARARAAELAPGYKPPEPAVIAAAGPSGKMTLVALLDSERKAGRLTDTDVAIGTVLAGVLTGGADADPVKPVSEAAIMKLEREALITLAFSPASMARIRHMLETGKPLRN